MVLGLVLITYLDAVLVLVHRLFMVAAATAATGFGRRRRRRSRYVVAMATARITALVTRRRMMVATTLIVRRATFTCSMRVYGVKRNRVSLSSVLCIANFFVLYRFA